MPVCANTFWADLRDRMGSDFYFHGYAIIVGPIDRILELNEFYAFLVDFWIFFYYYYYI